MSTDQSTTNNTGLIVCLLLSSSLLVLLYFNVFTGLVSDWMHLPDFSHGFLVPLIPLYLIWDKKEILKAAPVQPANSGLFILVSGLFLLLLGTAATEYFTMRFSFLVVLAGAVVFLCGYPFFRLLLFPIFFLIFMIPIPSILVDKITFPLQLFASNFAVSCIDLLGIPVLREGNVIHLANTSLEVAEACSGIRSFVTLLGLGSAFAYFAQKATLPRIFLILSCVPIAILVNAFRVTLTGVLASFFGSSVAEGLFHTVEGYFLFVLALLLLLLLNLSINFFRRRLEKAA
jgi:exosortase